MVSKSTLSENVASVMDLSETRELELVSVVKESGRVRKRGVPLHYQLVRSLKDDILCGRFRQDEKLPSESQLMDMFQVSRLVVRQALSTLREEELVVSHRGKGTFVTNGTSRPARVFSGYIEDLAREGVVTNTKVLCFDMVKASPELARVFQVQEGADFFHVKRMLQAEGQPFNVVESYLPYEVGALIPPGRLEYETHFRLVEEYCGISIAWASEVVEAVAADAELAPLLDIAPSAPTLKTTITVHSTDGRVVLLVTVHYRADRHKRYGYLRRRPPSEGPGWVRVA
jgi:GntR family transcriptional regulator